MDEEANEGGEVGRTSIRKRVFIKYNITRYKPTYLQ